MTTATTTVPAELKAARVAYDEAAAAWAALGTRKAEARQLVETFKGRRVELGRLQAEALKKRATQGGTANNTQRLSEIRADLGAIEISIQEAEAALEVFPTVQLEAASAFGSAHGRLKSAISAHARLEVEKAHQRLLEAISGPLAEYLSYFVLAWETPTDAGRVLKDLPLHKINPAPLPVRAAPAFPYEVRTILAKAEEAAQAKARAETEARVRASQVANFAPMTYADVVEKEMALERAAAQEEDRRDLARREQFRKESDDAWRKHNEERKARQAVAGR